MGSICCHTVSHWHRLVALDGSAQGSCCCFFADKDGVPPADVHATCRTKAVSGQLEYAGHATASIRGRDHVCGAHAGGGVGAEDCVRFAVLLCLGRPR